MNYSQFVNEQKLSAASTSAITFFDGLYSLESTFDQLPRLLVGAIGASSESGELLLSLSSINTKADFIDELGDVIFYLTVSQWALGIKQNITYDSFEYQIFQYELMKDYDIKDAVLYLVINTAKYLDIIKKFLFQGKPINDINLHKLRDLYHNIYKTILLITNLIEVTLEVVQQTNMDKLNIRYKEKFSVTESENKLN